MKSIWLRIVIRDIHQYVVMDVNDIWSLDLMHGNPHRDASHHFSYVQTEPVRPMDIYLVE